MITSISNQLTNINLDLLSVGLAISGILLLGVIVLLSERNSITNRAFFLFSIINVIWGISNYFEYQLPTIDATLWALRIHLFLSTWYSLSFFTLAYVFPKEKTSFPRWYRYLILPTVIFTSLLTLTPLVFYTITKLAPLGEVTN